jgi:hypothetical protein
MTTLPFAPKRTPNVGHVPGFPFLPFWFPFPNNTVPHADLRHQLNDTAGLDDLLLGELADPPGPDDDGDVGEAALAEDLGVAEGEEVEDGGGILLGAGDVGIAGLSGDEAPEL